MTADKSSYPRSSAVRFSSLCVLCVLRGSIAPRAGGLSPRRLCRRRAGGPAERAALEHFGLHDFSVDDVADPRLDRRDAGAAFGEDLELPLVAQRAVLRLACELAGHAEELADLVNGFALASEVDLDVAEALAERRPVLIDGDALEHRVEAADEALVLCNEQADRARRGSRCRRRPRRRRRPVLHLRDLRGDAGDLRAHAGVVPLPSLGADGG